VRLRSSRTTANDYISTSMPDPWLRAVPQSAQVYGGLPPDMVTILAHPVTNLAQPGLPAALNGSFRVPESESGRLIQRAGWHNMRGGLPAGALLWHRPGIWLAAARQASRPINSTWRSRRACGDHRAIIRRCLAILVPTLQRGNAYAGRRSVRTNALERRLSVGSHAGAR
jgi:hypothetical protein